MLEIAGIIILGIFAQWIAWRAKVPAILPLILIGLMVGPFSTLWTAGGEKLLEPVYNPETQQGLFPGKSLFYFVSLAIGIILFEGGLTLKRNEIKEVGPVIGKLITLGSIITFIGAGLAAHYIVGIGWPISFLFGALIIVTGPTVIAPILQNVPLHRNIATVLKWEGILIDPIGALIAVIVFEFVRSSGGDFTMVALLSFGKILSVGFLVGISAAFSLFYLIKKNLIPHYLLNVFTLAFVLVVFVGSDQLSHESGLLSVVVMGLFLANMDLPQLKDILTFKESLSVLLISILFILLAANIDMPDLQLIWTDYRTLILFLFVAFILRPISVFISTSGSELTVNEKIFISWVGPRGIVAAGIASLFGITLSAMNVPDAEYIVPLVFLIVLGTVVLNATLARPIAYLLKVVEEASDGILILGGNKAARVIASYLKKENRHVIVIDSNLGNIQKAHLDGLEAYQSNIYTDDLEEKFELVDVGYILAMTSNVEVNNYALNQYRDLFGENGAYRLITSEEMSISEEELPQDGLISYYDDFLNLNEVARDFPYIHEVSITSAKEYSQELSQIIENPKMAPLFFKNSNGTLFPIEPKLGTNAEFGEDCKLVYLGKPLGYTPDENKNSEPKQTIDSES